METCICEECTAILFVCLDWFFPSVSYLVLVFLSCFFLFGVWLFVFFILYLMLFTNSL